MYYLFPGLSPYLCPYGQDETEPGRETAKGELAELLDLMDKVPLVHHAILNAPPPF